MVETASALRRRQLSPVELVDVFLERIKEGSRLNAFISAPGQPERRQARRAAQSLVRKEPGRLLGVPIAIKDLFATRGQRTTAGSRILRDWVPRSDSEVVGRLRAEGALIFGKANLHEFAYGVTNGNPWWGIARNPHDERRVPGGSSGGSAIAVVAGMASAAIGSDTGGSIRIPASLCGCVGLKPTYGRIPLDGAIPLGWSLDHAGPLTRGVDDAGVLFDILARSDSWQRVRSRPSASLRGIRVGLLHGKLLEPCEAAIMAALEEAAGTLARSGLRVRKLEVSELEWTVATQLVTLRAEASAVHARWLRSRPRSYGRDVRARLQLGALVSASDYVIAQRMRLRIRKALEAAFDEVDVLLLPSTPITAPLVGSRAVRWRRREEPVDAALVRLTAPFNLTGVPALSVPWQADGDLPIGLQLVAPWNEEARVLAVGRLLEAASK
jgi:aspartyl-tRNA(Asn)/glutamyl-tRNA(Gln) amidotransferase subunit A